MADFFQPFFVENSSAEEIQQRMMNALPPDIDGMPGGFAYDFTMPTAIEKSEAINFHIIRTLMLMFPDWAWGEWLDLHAAQCSLQRKAAVCASGYITISGTPGKRLSAGFIFCTPSTESTPSALYSLDESVTIPEEGSITAPITAVEPGPASNVSAGMITIMSNPVEGIISITNESAVTGGTEEESDDDLRERIAETYASSGTSYIGNDSDYIRWALEVDGIGGCIVTQAWNGPGTVKLSLVDSNGDPANDRLCEAVYDHIVSPEDRMSRLLPTGTAELTVMPADSLSISYSCENLTYNAETTSIDQIKEDFIAALSAYYTQAKEDGVVKWNIAHALLTKVTGVEDFTDFLINGKTGNVKLENSVYPRTGAVTLSE